MAPQLVQLCAVNNDGSAEEVVNGFFTQDSCSLVRVLGEDGAVQCQAKLCTAASLTSGQCVWTQQQGTPVCELLHESPNTVLSGEGTMTNPSTMTNPNEETNPKANLKRDLHSNRDVTVMLIHVDKPVRDGEAERVVAAMKSHTAKFSSSVVLFHGEGAETAKTLWCYGCFIFTMSVPTCHYNTGRLVCEWPEDEDDDDDDDVVSNANSNWVFGDRYD